VESVKKNLWTGCKNKETKKTISKSIFHGNIHTVKPNISTEVAGLSLSLCLSHCYGTMWKSSLHVLSLQRIDIDMYCSASSCLSIHPFILAAFTHFWNIWNALRLVMGRGVFRSCQKSADPLEAIEKTYRESTRIHMLMSSFSKRNCTYCCDAQVDPARCLWKNPNKVKVWTCSMWISEPYHLDC